MQFRFARRVNPRERGADGAAVDADELHDGFAGGESAESVHDVDEFAGLGLPRLAYRLYKDHSLALAREANATRVLILGAGRAGEMLLRELRAQDRYHAVGLLDDVPSLRGAKIQDVQVLGTLDELERVARETAASLLVITMPGASAAQMRRVVALCDQTGLPFRKVSRLSDQLDHDIGAYELREVAIEDLLGREPVAFDWQLVHEQFGDPRGAPDEEVVGARHLLDRGVHPVRGGFACAVGRPEHVVLGHGEQLGARIR